LEEKRLTSLLQICIIQRGEDGRKLGKEGSVAFLYESIRDFESKEKESFLFSME
jgi:predicted transcriptional regulator